MKYPSRLARTKLAIPAILCALLAEPSVAQQFPDKQQFPETQRQKDEETRAKAQEARKKAEREAIDEAYKAMMEQTPRTSKKIDPWGGLRAAPSK
jgi:hypothetical protein